MPSCWPCRCRRRWPKAASLLLGGLLLLVAVLTVFALVDVPLQRQLLKRRLRMSIEEVKKEMKEVEGNAEIGGKMELAHARDGQPPHARRGAARRPGGDEPHPLRGGNRVRRRDDEPRRA